MEVGLGGPRSEFRGRRRSTTLMSLLRNLCSFLVFTRSADRLTPTAAEAPQAREARGLSFFRAIGTVDRSERYSGLRTPTPPVPPQRYSGLRTPTPPVPPHGVRSEPPPLQDGGFFLCTVNAHLLISIVGTGEGDDLPEHSSDVDRSVLGARTEGPGNATQ
jgi:hypothetical protein